MKACNLKQNIPGRSIESFAFLTNRSEIYIRYALPYIVSISKLSTYLMTESSEEGDDVHIKYCGL